ncbi:hypothetical protein [Methylobacterium sp. WL116]|uniref:hypothetical protein n=1 Tax=Methylobacterium sp. WL116 TaxID=2603889 RepID=UPI0011C90172|nr:hypothetical protein [Methylobacterium sp. WL116]TXM94085.1 hypothetical protein FV223_05925 [Methylobacterium sp. WL116]
MTGNLSARAANGAHPQGMIGSYIEPFAEANIRHEAEVSIRCAECIALRFEQHVQHCSHVAAHLTAMFAPTLSRGVEAASSWIWRLCNSNDASPDAACVTPHQEVGLDRDRDPRNCERV